MAAAQQRPRSGRETTPETRLARPLARPLARRLARPIVRAWRAAFRRWALGSLLVVAGSFTPEVEAAPSRTLSFDESGRRLVRGDRPEGASIELAWAPTARRSDAAHRDTLAAFERASFPEQGPRQSIIREPPEPWMKKLATPDIPVRWNKRTVEYLRYFKDDPKGREMMVAWMRRAGRYEGRLRAILKAAGVPEDLVMVALAESGFNPGARSKVGAAGLWQFMEGTGAVYGLQRDYWIDERYDVEKSTIAAATYLADLKVRFGSWELALAAYNAGYGLVMTAMERHNTNNYWALCELESGLPYATTNYVPKIVAAALVSRNRKLFGVSTGDIEVAPPVDWVEVRVPRSTSMTELAAAIGVDAELLAELNAHLIRGRTPPRRTGFPVKIPRNALSSFEGALPKLRQAWSKEGLHTVRHGESLAEIARTHRMTERELRQMNGVEDSAEVAGGVVLVVRLDGEAEVEPAKPPLAAVPPVRPRPGQRLVFLVTTRAITPRVVERVFGIPWSDVLRWNDLDPLARLQSELVLQLVVPEAFDAKAAGVRIYERSDVLHVPRGSSAHIEASLQQRGLVRRAYKARRGDTLRKIGRRFDLTVGDLARINAFPREREPEAGELLVVYVPQDKVQGTVAPPAPLTGGTEPAPRKPSAAERPANPGKSKSQRAPSTAATPRLPGQ